MGCGWPVAAGAFDRERDRHGVENVPARHFGFAAVEQRSDERRDQVALERARIGIVEFVRRDLRIAAAVKPRRVGGIPPCRVGTEDDHVVEVRVDAGKVGADLRCQPVRETQQGDDRVVKTEIRVARGAPRSDGDRLFGALSGEPEQQVDHMDAAAMGHRVERQAAAPAVQNLLHSAVVVVAFEVVEVAELASFDERLEAREAGIFAQDEVRRDPRFRVLRQHRRDRVELLIVKAQRLFHEDMLACLDRVQDLCGVGVVVGRDGHDVDLGVIEDRLGVGAGRAVGLACGDGVEMVRVDVADVGHAAARVGLEPGDMRLTDPESDDADAKFAVAHAGTRESMPASSRTAFMP